MIYELTMAIWFLVPSGDFIGNFADQLFSTNSMLMLDSLPIYIVRLFATLLEYTAFAIFLVYPEYNYVNNVVLSIAFCYAI